MKSSERTVALAAVALMAAAAARADVTVLQDGVAPGSDYAGCTDTWISGEQWEQGHDYGRRPTLRCGGKRHMLVRYDLAPIPKGHVVHRAVLRLADVGYPRKRQGKWPVSMLAYRLTRAWHENANWLEHTRTNYKEKDAGDWATPGGEIDRESDFGQGEKGVIASDMLADGPWGHMHELDVTAVVQRWHSGKLPNHGLALAAPPRSHGCQAASSEWHVPAYRPKLIVSHSPKGGQPSPIPPLSPAPEKLEFHLAASPGTVADADVVWVGQNAQCTLRGASTDAYVKEAVDRFPGTWGWMTHCRVGGVAGDVSRALLYFDLSELRKGTPVHKATLRLSLTPRTSAQVTAYRYGAYLLRLPDAPGWNAAEVTAAQRKAGVPWPQPCGRESASRVHPPPLQR